MRQPEYHGIIYIKFTMLCPAKLCRVRDIIGARPISSCPQSGTNKKIIVSAGPVIVNFLNQVPFNQHRNTYNSVTVCPSEDKYRIPLETFGALLITSHQSQLLDNLSSKVSRRALWGIRAYLYRLENKRTENRAMCTENPEFPGQAKVPQNVQELLSPRAHLR